MSKDQFYPTPDSVINIMLSGLDFKHAKTFLDPSAGQGHILDVIANKRNSNYDRYSHRDDKSGLFAIEINPGRQAILRDKGYKVIDSDFLAHPGLQYFDYIIINPPFDDGASHLLKAWDDVANGAIIRCLINSETLNNPYTEERKRLKSIVTRYGWSKELGAAFSDAEHRTNVRVTLIHLHDTRKQESFRVDFEPKIMNGRFKVDEIEDNALVSPNVFSAYEARYNAGVEAFKELLLARQKVDFFLNPLLTEYKSGKNLAAEALKGSQGADVCYQQFLRDVTRESWNSLFAKTKLGHVTTENVRKELEQAQVEQGVMAFTASNMEALFNQLFLSREQIMLSCILEAFDSMTKHYEGNREYYESWKTNSAYKVGKRFILPSMGAAYHEGLDYSAKRKVEDIEKALCFLEGKPFDSIMSVTSVYNQDSHYGKKMSSEFFITKLYRKGTFHFLWKDFDLMSRFNAMVAKERWGELPEKTKSGAYK